jgi:acyl-CoA synthetase (NDP forming)
VNRRAAEVQGLPAFPSVAALPEAPDLAIVAVAAEGAAEALEACATKGTKAAVVFSSGFAELGAAGEVAQERLGEIAQRTGMRVLGPNCLGAVSVASAASPPSPSCSRAACRRPGPLGIASQSGNLGSYTMLLARERGIGVSRFITTGNECDIDIADAIAWLAGDPATKVILCVLETCRDAPRLVAALEAARRAGKPVIVLKIGATEAGQAAAASHTGALAGSDAVFDAVFRRTGAVPGAERGGAARPGPCRGGAGERLPREQAHHAAHRLRRLRRAAGRCRQRRRAGAADAERGRAAAHPLGGALRLAAEPGRRHRADVEQAGDPDRDPRRHPGRPELRLAGAAAGGLALHPRLRGVFMPALKAMAERHPEKVLMLSVHGPADAVAELTEHGMPVVDGVDPSAATLAGLCALAEARRTPPHAPIPLPAAAPLDPAALRTEAGGQAGAGRRRPAGPARARRPQRRRGRRGRGRFGFPVVLKIVSPDLPHKTEVGGVALGLDDATAVAAAHDAMLARVRAAAPRARIEGVLVSPMVTGGVELILGTKRDPVFGPVVLVGLGGIFAEVLQDVAVRPAPVEATRGAGHAAQPQGLPGAGRGARPPEGGCRRGGRGDRRPVALRRAAGGDGGGGGHQPAAGPPRGPGRRGAGRADRPRSAGEGRMSLENEAYRRRVRDFLATQVPEGFLADRPDHAPPGLEACKAWEAAMHRAGLAGITWPEPMAGTA